MGAKYEEVTVVPINADAVWQRAIQVLNAHPRIAEVRTHPDMLTGRVKISWRSWGEELTVRVDPGPDGTHVFVRSECEAPFQIIDWGKNRANVQLIILGLEPPAQTDESQS